MDVIIEPLIALIDAAVSIYIWILIIAIVMSWLVNFNVINPYNQFVRMVWGFSQAITEPALRPIRNLLGRFLPNLGGLDISPIILILLLYFARDVIIRVLLRLA